MVRFKAISYEQRLKIAELLPTGASLRKIGILMGRSPNFAIAEVRRNGGRENYCPHKAQEEAQEIKLQKYNKIFGNVQENIHHLSFSRRIDNLENQVKILYETIKEMMKNA